MPMKLRSKQTIILTFDELEAMINKYLKDNGSDVQITVKDYAADHFKKEIAYNVVETTVSAFPITANENLSKTN